MTAATAPRWLTDRERHAWLSFLATTSLLEDALDRQLQRDSDLPHAYYLLMAMLSEAPGRAMRMTQLAEITNSSPSRISHAVARLEEAGWVQRAKCPTDKRRDADRRGPGDRRGCRPRPCRGRPPGLPRCAHAGAG